MRIEPNPYQWDRVNLRLFYGRQSLADELCRGTQEGHSYAVIGGLRMGKTTLLRRIEADLVERSRQLTGLAIMPIYVDILGLSHPLTPHAIYREILILIEQNLRRIVQLPSAWQPLYTFLDRWPGEENRAFREGIQTIVHDCADRYLQIIVLIDEIEPIVRDEWGQGFFNNWRQFLSNDPGVTEHVTAIFSGAREMEFIARDIGSPLSNVLTWKELTLFSDEEAMALVNDPTDDRLPPTVVEHILNWTGGHPFLIQYLMHQICESDLEEAEVQLEYAAKRFSREQDGQFRSWWFDKFNSTDRLVYALVADGERAASRKEIISQVGDVPADQTLRILSHTGVIRRASGVAESYRVAGQLFEQWYQQHGILSFEHGGHDPILERKLHALVSGLADRYITAWQLLGADLRSYSGAVSEIRDVLTQVLHILAPDQTVMSAPGYVAEQGQTRPTRRQRAAFTVRQRDTAPALERDMMFLDTLLEQLGRTVNDAYGHASSRTHIRATHRQAWKCLKQLDSVLAQLLPDD